MTFIKRKIENADESTPKRAVVTELKLGVAQGTEPQGLLPSSTWNCNFEPEKMTKLFNGTISALAFVNEKGEINTISYLGYSTSSDDKLAGHVGTNIDVSVPAMVPKQAILENVLGIMGKNDAEEQGFIFHDYNLNNPILNLSDVTLPALNLSNKVPDELRADDAFPVLTIIPKCYPLGWGKAFPTGKIDDDEVQATCQESEDGLLAWSRTLAHLYNENQGNTVTGAKQMINILPHLPITIRDQWNAALNANHGSPGTVPITTDVRPLFPDDTDAKRVIKAVEAAGQSRWGEFLNGNNAARKILLFSEPAITNAGGASNSDVSKLAEAIADSKSSLDPGSKKKNMATIRILTGNRDPATGEITFKDEDELNEYIRGLVKSGVNANVPVDLFGELANFHDSQAKAGKSNIATEAVPAMYNRISWHKLFAGQLRVRPYINAADYADVDTWSPYNLAPQDTESAEYKARVQKATEESNQQAAGWSEKKTSKSSTSAFRSTEIISCKGLCEMVANTGEIFLFVVASNDQEAVEPENWPWITVMAEQLIQTVLANTSADGKNSPWIQELNTNCPWFWFAVGKIWNNLIAKMSAWAKNTQVNQALQRGLVPTKDDEQVVAIHSAFKQLCAEIKQAKENGDGGSLAGSHHPIWFPKTCPNKAVEMGIIASPNNDKDTGAEGGNNNHKGKGKGKGKGKQDAQTGPGGGRGAGVFNTEGIFNKPNTQAKTETKDVPMIMVGSKERVLCIRGCTIGTKCTFQHTEKGCFNYHFENLDDFNKLSNEKKKEFYKCAKNSGNLEMAEGFAPKETPPNANGGGGGGGKGKGKSKKKEGENDQAVEEAKEG
jgi:hypothetical protein